MERLGVDRALMLTGRTLSGGALLETLRVVAGGRVASVFGEVVAHNPTSTVDAATAAFKAADADGLVAFGGGSVVDCCRGAKVDPSSGRRRTQSPSAWCDRYARSVWTM